jgi:hypothetical protein
MDNKTPYAFKVIIDDNWRPFLDDSNLKSTIPTYTEYLYSQTNKKVFTSIFNNESKNAKIRKYINAEHLSKEEEFEKSKLLYNLKNNINNSKKKIKEYEFKHNDCKRLLFEKKQEELDRQRMQIELWNEYIKTKSQSVVHTKKKEIITKKLE